jgi:hypothetical protein
MTVDWRSVHLWGAGRVGRVVGTYEVFDARVPSGGMYQIKVIEEASGRFTAYANVGLKGPDGFSAAGAGMGRSEVEALKQGFTNSFSPPSRRQ